MIDKLTIERLRDEAIRVFEDNTARPLITKLARQGFREQESQCSEIPRSEEAAAAWAFCLSVSDSPRKELRQLSVFSSDPNAVSEYRIKETLLKLHLADNPGEISTAQLMAVSKHLQRWRSLAIETPSLDTRRKSKGGRPKGSVKLSSHEVETIDFYRGGKKQKAIDDMMIARSNAKRFDGSEWREGTATAVIKAAKARGAISKSG